MCNQIILKNIPALGVNVDCWSCLGKKYPKLYPKLVTLICFQTRMNQEHLYSDEEILQMLQDETRRKIAIAQLYSTARGHVIRMVVKYGGSEDDALEILSEGVMVFLQNIAQGKFRHGSQLKVYLIGICKFLWRDHRRKNIQLNQVPIEAHLEPVLKETVADHLDRMDTVALIQRCMDHLQDACRELFRWRFFEGQPAAWEVIADRLGYDNAQVARNKGQRCLKSLKKIYFEIIANVDRK